MKRMINASRENLNQLPITDLTEDTISMLPDKVTVVTRVPGSSRGAKIYEVVSKDKLANPDKCLFIDSYWGYAHGHDIYIASKSAVAAYMKSKIDAIEQEYDKYRRYAL